jgi:dipeptidase
MDGSMMVTHSDDDELGDQRIIHVPAMTHDAGAMREVYKEHYRYPRIVSDRRGPHYDTPGYPRTQPIGFIPQVSATYAYFDGNYGIMNEHNLMLGECTNGAKYQPDAVTKEEAETTGRHIRLFYSSELSRVALERCKTAQDAIRCMGELIETYGYYSSGETLLVADENEGWVFEMCALPDEQYHSVWVAQKVPDGTLFAAANEFRIRRVEKGDPDIIHSHYLFAGLEKVGWWNPDDGPLDWLPTVSDGEYNHPYYSLRRIWRIFERVNPNLGLSPWVNDGYTTAYPFSIKPCRKLDAREVFALYRDHYEGTQFDMTRGVAAGPYGDPHRFTGPYDGSQNNITMDKTFYGAWERAISVFYQGYTYVCQTRPDKPDATKGLVWFGPDVSYTTCFTPFFVKVKDLPEPYQIGDPQQFSRDAAWWAFDFVANWSRLNFQRMTGVDIQPLQKELEEKQIELVAQYDEKLKNKGLDEATEQITEFCNENVEKLLERWWALSDRLIAKYSDGYINPPGQDNDVKEIGYSSLWLSYTDYKDGPTSYRMKHSG